MTKNVKWVHIRCKCGVEWGIPVFENTYEAFRCPYKNIVIAESCSEFDRI